MPVEYSGLIAEHMAVRKAAGLFDVSHMGEFEVEGAGRPRLPAARHLATTWRSWRTARRSTRRCRCRTARPVDDVIVYRRAARALPAGGERRQHREGLGAGSRRRASRAARSRDRSDDVRSPGAPGTAGPGDPAAAHADRPRGDRLLPLRRGPGGRPSRRSSPAPATRARTASSSSSRPSTADAALARAARGGRDRRASSPRASARATRCGSRRGCASTATTWTRPPRLDRGRARLDRLARRGQGRLHRPWRCSSPEDERRAAQARGLRDDRARHRAPRLPGLPRRRGRGRRHLGHATPRSSRRTSVSATCPPPASAVGTEFDGRDPRPPRGGARRADAVLQAAALRPPRSSHVSRGPTATRRTTSGSAVEGDRGTVGITDYAQKQLGDVVFLELPEVGRHADGRRDASAPSSR